MKDLNFFEPFLNKNTRFSGEKARKQFIIGGLSALMILYPLYNAGQIYRANREVVAAGLIVNSSEIQEGKETMEELLRKQQELQEEKNSLEEVEKAYSQKDVINDFLMYAITNHIPEGIFLESMRIDNEKIQLQGVAKDKISIAILENNIRKTEEFREIFISSIIENSGNYTFILSFSIEDGDEE